jgi:hypothetical protein
MTNPPSDQTAEMNPHAPLSLRRIDQAESWSENLYIFVMSVGATLLFPLVFLFGGRDQNSFRESSDNSPG